MGEVRSSVQELHDLGQGINLSEPQFPNLQELVLLCFLSGRTFRIKQTLRPDSPDCSQPGLTWLFSLMTSGSVWVALSNWKVLGLQGHSICLSAFAHVLFSAWEILFPEARGASQSQEFTRMPGHS